MPEATPTIVLVHGAFADASGWKGVYDKLAGDGHVVKAPPNPLRGLISDGAYIRSFVEQIDGPVLLVGHSYGGAVITVAGVADNVVGLVYVAGFAPDEGENLADLQGRFEVSAALPHLQPAAFPTDGTEFSIDPDWFPTVFAGDVPKAEAEFMANSQRPLSGAAFGEPASAAAWRTKPSWAAFPTADQTINPDVHRFSYERAGATVTEIEGASHVVMISHPGVVADIVLQALEGVAAQPVGMHSAL
jgi:pimeloyl-ACP methyl ester carboxylesterase